MAITHHATSGCITHLPLYSMVSLDRSLAVHQHWTSSHCQLGKPSSLQHFHNLIKSSCTILKDYHHHTSHYIPTQLDIVISINYTLSLKRIIMFCNVPSSPTRDLEHIKRLHSRPLHYLNPSRHKTATLLSAVNRTLIMLI